MRDKKELEGRVSELTDRLGHFTNIEETLNKSILIAQEAAEDVKRNAEKEAKLIIKEAEKMRTVLLMKHCLSLVKIAMDIEETKKQSKVFRTRFKMLIEAQLEMLNNDDWDQLMDYEMPALEEKID